MTRRLPAAVDAYASIIAATGAMLCGVCAVGLMSTPYAREWAILGALAHQPVQVNAFVL